ncbi:MAG: asparagine synthase (glutamine-hydrolyzing) [Deltaproteobacteria bacterium]|nr:asparagine synthase (glutamine-hydrolyzing) [Deltaproteobacteria bacterium]
MCGICGYTRSHRDIPEGIIDDMKDALVHRGPDEEGTYADDQIVLGHRRLSIIDLEGGRQPMASEGGRIIVVCNGEIYNYVELRKFLEQRGHRFSSRCDTEILVHLFEEYGIDMVRRLTGMFAMAVWDSGDRALVLVRDRFGQKPLYYAERDGQLIFASELGSLVKHPGIEKKIDKTALSRYLAYQYVPAPFSIYEGVYKLDAGSCLEWKRGKVRTFRYWDFPVGRSNFDGTIDECCSELSRLLGDSVRRRLISDVPIGVFLSGGVDSTAIVALMARHMPPQAIKTFSIGFTEKRFDESAYARSVARYFGTAHEEEILEGTDLIDMLPKVAEAYDEPFADPSAIPTYLLSRFARRHVIVALGGDGGDELFAGYEAFIGHRIARLFEYLPDSLRRGVFPRLAGLFPPSDGNMSFPFAARRFFSHLEADSVRRNQLWLGAFDYDSQKELLAGEFSSGLADPFDDERRDNERLHYLDAVAYSYIRTYLQEDILTKVDRASMAHGLEVRAPFLDHEFGEFAGSIPMRWKLKGLTPKYLLKRAMSGLIPGEVLKRRKRGFAIPRSKWLREDLGQCLRDLFTEERVKEQGTFSYTYVRRLMEEHFDRKSDHQKELWTLLMFEMWRGKHGGSMS